MSEIKQKILYRRSIDTTLFDLNIFLNTVSLIYLPKITPFLKGKHVNNDLIAFLCLMHLPDSIVLVKCVSDIVYSYRLPV